MRKLEQDAAPQRRPRRPFQGSGAPEAAAAAAGPERQAATPAEGEGFPLGLTLQELEKRYVAATLLRLSGNVTAAAESLGIDRSTLYEKIKRYAIPRQRRRVGVRRS